MKHIFTPEDLIAYLYSETTLAKRLAIQEALRRDPALSIELESLRIAQQQFPKVRFTAPKRSLNAILQYSQSTRMEEYVQP
ncbi:MAG: hypothetical protein R2795_17310 [Saprospiraceae bacterium]